MGEHWHRVYVCLAQVQDVPGQQTSVSSPALMVIGLNDSVVKKMPARTPAVC
jgi:hypothetical protein